MSICDDYVTKYGTIESNPELQNYSYAMPSESTIQPMESQSVQSSLAPSEVGASSDRELPQPPDSVKDS